MGIKGLMADIKNAMRERHLRAYNGKTAAVDTYAWLHKIIKGPSGKQLILGGSNRYKYVDDCMKRIRKLMSQGIQVIMVFDGGPLPSKREQQESRKRRRDKTFAQGKEMLDQGDEAGFKKLIDSIDISPDIANRLIDRLKTEKVKFIVAPYEADAQLAYLSREGIADVIITEDSDLMAFGAKKMLYKLDFTTLVGSELDLDQLKNCREANFAWFTHCMFLTTCILSGCDYLAQINGIGLKTAQKHIGRVTTFNGFLGQLGCKSSDVPYNYHQNFMKAFLTFRFQRVFCPKRRACVELNDFSNLNISLEDLNELQKYQKPWSSEVLNVEVLEYVKTTEIMYDFLGQKYNDELMCAIADGMVHPVTFEKFDEHFAQALTCVPKVPIKMNSTLFNARRPPGRSKGNNKFQAENNGINRFLSKQKSQDIQKLDLSEFDYKNGNASSGNQRPKPPSAPIKGGLKFRDDEEDQDIEEESPIVSEISQEIEQISQHLPKNTMSQPINLLANESEPPQRCKDTLQRIAEDLFTQIFSQEYLKSPFSF